MKRASVLAASLLLAGCASSGSPATSEEPQLRLADLLVCDHERFGFQIDCESLQEFTPLPVEPGAGWSCVAKRSVGDRPPLFYQWHHQDGREGMEVIIGDWTPEKLQYGAYTLRYASGTIDPVPQEEWGLWSAGGSFFLATALPATGNIRGTLKSYTYSVVNSTVEAIRGGNLHPIGFVTGDSPYTILQFTSPAGTYSVDPMGKFVVGDDVNYGPPDRFIVQGSDVSFELHNTGPLTAGLNWDAADAPVVDPLNLNCPDHP